MAQGESKMHIANTMSNMEAISHSAAASQARTIHSVNGLHEFMSP